jgi:peptidoglycan/xylan/chitin deacetylase (PgdA/CDA1 family)
MKFYWIKTNVLIKKIFTNYIWDIPTKKKIVYLTFDDGPTPEITEWVLSQLKKYDAKATFFSIGNNIEKYPGIFKTILQQGHAIGNHTHDHLNGWQTNQDYYLDNCKRCEEQILLYKKDSQQSKLFRPPYGKIKIGQTKQLIKSGYKIIMWDVLSADFDHSITPEKSLENVISNINRGSIIVFHDSVKAFKNLEYVLPKTLDFLKKEGYKLEAISYT